MSMPMPAPEPLYPSTCLSCARHRNGPVKYCPYCGTQEDAASVKEPVVEVVTVDHVSGPVVESPSTKNEMVTPPSEGPAEAPPSSPPANALAIEAPPQTPPPSSDGQTARLTTSVTPPPKPWKWIAVAALLVVVIAGYLLSHRQGAPPEKTVHTEPSQGTEVVAQRPPVGIPSEPKRSVNAAQNQGQRESARGIAIEALRQGTDLSVAITKLPKLEKVRQAAQSLVEISPRYQEQVDTAETTVKNTSKTRDSCLMAYINKVTELGQYSPEQISYAMGVIQNGEQGPREKIVSDLLATHVISLRKNTKVNSKKLLSDFIKRFSNFVD